MNNFVLYTLTVLIWGSTWFAITFQLGEVHPILSVSYRFFLAAGLLLGYLVVFKKRDINHFSKSHHILFALLGFYLFGLNYVLFYFGTNYLTSGLVAIIFSTMTFMNIFNQNLFFGIKVKRQVIIGCVIGLCGIVMVFWPELKTIHGADGTLLGMALCLLASYSASIGNMVSMQTSRSDIPVMQANTYGMAYGASFCLLLALCVGAPITFEASIPYVSSLFYLSILGSAVAFYCYLTLMKNIGADKASYATILFPIVALVISTLFEGYIWTPLSITGVALTLSGNIIAMFNRERMLHWRRTRKLSSLK